MEMHYDRSTVCVVDFGFQTREATIAGQRISFLETNVNLWNCLCFLYYNSVKICTFDKENKMCIVCFGLFTDF